MQVYTIFFKTTLLGTLVGIQQQDRGKWMKTLSNGILLYIFTTHSVPVTSLVWALSSHNGVSVRQSM
jgi:hypothetical protein